MHISESICYVTSTFLLLQLFFKTIFKNIFKKTFSSDNEQRSKPVDNNKKTITKEVLQFALSI